MSSLRSPESGGLRAGWVQFKEGAYTFHGYSFVPGVTIFGDGAPSGSANLRVGGSAAAHGRLHHGAHRALVTGTLGGHHVHILPTAGASAAIVGPMRGRANTWVLGALLPVLLLASWPASSSASSATNAPSAAAVPPRRCRACLLGRVLRAQLHPLRG